MPAAHLSDEDDISAACRYRYPVLRIHFGAITPFPIRYGESHKLRLGLISRSLQRVALLLVSTSPKTSTDMYGLPALNAVVAGNDAPKGNTRIVH